MSAFVNLPDRLDALGLPVEATEVRERLSDAESEADYWRGCAVQAENRERILRRALRACPQTPEVKKALEDTHPLGEACDDVWDASEK
jgi:hypothetical protein